MILFSYFWVSVMFRPIQIADDLKKYGGYALGFVWISHCQVLDFIMTRLTLAGSIFLTFIAVFLDICSSRPTFRCGSPSFSGAQGCITVGVMLDTMRQIEAHLLQRHYDGFLKKGKSRAVNTKSLDTGLAGATDMSNGPALHLLLVIFSIGIALGTAIISKLILYFMLTKVHHLNFFSSLLHWGISVCLDDVFPVGKSL